MLLSITLPIVFISNDHCLAPGLTPGVVEDELVVLSEAVSEIAHSLVRGGREGLINVQVETFVSLELEVLPDKGNDPTYLFISINLKNSSMNHQL